MAAGRRIVRAQARENVERRHFWPFTIYYRSVAYSSRFICSYGC
ncbi:MAG: hypothetical protein N3D76_03850 [Geminocystis sp.]|nr:hypothetical protein [Geminocystis sp.]